MAPHPESGNEDPGIRGRHSLAGPSPLLWPHPMSLDPPSRITCTLGTALRPVQWAVVAAPSINLPRLPTIAMETERCYYGGRRNPNFLSPPRCHRRASGYQLLLVAVCWLSRSYCTEMANFCRHPAVSDPLHMLDPGTPQRED